MAAEEWRVTADSKSDLVKYYMTSLVVITAMASYAVTPTPFEATTFLVCSAGTGLLSPFANSINQLFEVPFDVQMLQEQTLTDD